MMNLNQYSLGIKACFFIMLLHFVCVVHGEEVTISEDKDYYLNTGDSAKFGCTETANIKVLQYSGTNAAQETTTEVPINSGSAGKWECSKDFGESAAKAPSIVEHNSNSYVLAFNKFDCAAADENKAGVYCQVVKSSNNGARVAGYGNNFFYGLIVLFSLYFLA